jgi:hypothetical protein
MQGGAEVVGSPLEGLVEDTMRARGFERQGAYWNLSALGLSFRHKRVKAILAHVAPEELPAKIRGEIDHHIERAMR